MSVARKNRKREVCPLMTRENLRNCKLRNSQKNAEYSRFGNPIQGTQMGK